MSNILINNMNIYIKGKKYVIQKNIIDNDCIYIFTNGYCGNFAYVLKQYLYHLSLGYIYNNNYHEIDHWFLYDKNTSIYYDINGKQTKDEIIKNIYNCDISNIDFYYDVSLEDYNNIGLWDNKDNYLVDYIIDTYLDIIK